MWVVRAGKALEMQEELSEEPQLKSNSGRGA